MTFEEKGRWVYLLVNIGTYGAYLSLILARAGGLPLTEVPYVSTMLWTIGMAIALSVAGVVLIALLKPSDAGKKDQRDKEIDRFGEYVGGAILAVAVLVPFVLALAEADHFWIANAMYLAFVLSALVGTIVKLVAYRRGL